MRILVLAPHTDDGEFGVGASIARWVAEGHEVHYVAFSGCAASVPPGWPADVLLTEVREATAVLGLSSSQVRVLDFEVRRFARDRQEILQAMVSLADELHPAMVLLPHTEDLHQDHHVVAVEGLRAFKRVTVLAYEIPWNNIAFRAVSFTALHAEHVETKVRAVKCYVSQRHRAYADPGFLRAQLRYRGTQIGIEYAECFEVYRWIQ